MENQEAILESTLEELSRCYESLSAFYQLGKALVHSENVDIFIQRALQDLRKIVSYDSVIVYIGKNIDSKLHESIAIMPYHHELDLDNNPNILKALQSSNEYIWSGNPSDPLIQQYKCGVCTPIRADGKPLGLLIISRKSQDNFLKASELNTIRTYSELFGIAIAQANNVILREQAQRAFSELEIAAEIQQKLLPVPPKVENPEYSLFAIRKSAREVAGDYVDVLTNKNGDQLLIVFDVMGKGVSAALLAGMIRSALKAYVIEFDSLENIITHLNKSICEQVGDLTLFATCGAALVKRKQQTIEILNAAHCPPLLFRNNKLLSEIAPSGPPLGLFSESPYLTETFPLEGKEAVIIVTDGLYEWKSNDTIWGWDNFKSFSLANSNLTPETYWNLLQNEIISSDDSGASDDQTLLYWKSHV